MVGIERCVRARAREGGLFPCEVQIHIKVFLHLSLENWTAMNNHKQDSIISFCYVAIGQGRAMMNGDSFY